MRGGQNLPILLHPITEISYNVLYVIIEDIVSWQKSKKYQDVNVAK